jgi:hypothetical protein
MTLEGDIVDVLAKDLGPSAPQFLKRQSEHHLKKPPANITKDDLEELAKWCFIGVKLTLGEQTATKVKDNILRLK